MKSEELRTRKEEAEEWARNREGRHSDRPYRSKPWRQTRARRSEGHCGLAGVSEVKVALSGAGNWCGEIVLLGNFGINILLLSSGSPFRRHFLEAFSGNSVVVAEVGKWCWWLVTIGRSSKARCRNSKSMETRNNKLELNSSKHRINHQKVPFYEKEEERKSSEALLDLLAAAELECLPQNRTAIIAFYI